MGRRKKHPKLPNGYGSIKCLSGKNRTNPYGVYPPTTEFDINGNPLTPKALCYVDDWYKGFAVLTWYKHGEYYPGREKELTESGAKLEEQIAKVLSKYSQSKREESEQTTFEEVYKAFYEYKYKVPCDHKGKKTSSEYSTRAAFKNSTVLHKKSFRTITTNQLQAVVDDCPLAHSSLELIVLLFHQMYAFADSNDLCNKDYSKYVKINIEDDDEHGIPFTGEEMKILWENKDNEIVEMLLIICYSGFRISEYLDIDVNLEEQYFFGGIKTDAGRERIVPIYSGISDLVKRRMKRDGKMLSTTTGTFRENMYDTLDALGIEKHTPHDCRHTFSKLCDDYYVLETDKKLMLGHAFNDVTNKVYLHRDLERLRNEIEKIKICY